MAEGDVRPESGFRPNDRFGGKAALARTLSRIGFASLANYALHKLRLRNGYYQKKAPVSTWEQVDTVSASDCLSPFEKPDLDLVREKMSDPDAAIELGERILARDWRYFSHRWHRIPDSWAANPATGAEIPRGHWSTLPESTREFGDIKWIWEPSRFDWVFALARAWAASGDEKYVEGFWRLFEDWVDKNPPNGTIAWRCGQETSLRLMTLVWAAGIFRDTAPSTPSRLDRLWTAVAAFAQRVEVSIGYAKSQGNNHALAESAGIAIAGICLTNHPSARRWRAKGLKIHWDNVRKQFFDDGSYSMHSLNYERVALRDAFVVITVCRKAGIEVPQDVTDLLAKAPVFLNSLLVQESGALPNYGANDGTNIWNLSSAPFGDYRPAINTLTWLLTKRRIYAGAADEELAWHFGEEPFSHDIDPLKLADHEAARTGGYYVLRRHDELAMIRCHAYETRPLQADMLHLDLWIDGVNVLADGGSYQYFDEQGWGEYLDSTAAHNTVNVGGHSQMPKGGRFLWLDWVQGQATKFREDAFAGQCSPAKGATHRRSVAREEDGWTIVDSVRCAATSKIQLRWHLLGRSPWKGTSPGVCVCEDPECRIEISSELVVRTTLLDGEQHLPETGRSPCYGSMVPCQVMVSEIEASEVRWITRLSRGPKSGIS